VNEKSRYGGRKQTQALGASFGGRKPRPCARRGTIIATFSYADEDGVSFWLPGLFGSLAAVPQKTGWQVTAINYFDSVRASGNWLLRVRSQSASSTRRSTSMPTSMSSRRTGSYVFEKPVFGGQ
jgi:hypothetical protein